MFLKKITSIIKGKSYFHYQVVESYREEGKVKHRTLYSVGVLTDDEAERLRTVIAAQSDKSIIATRIDDIVVTKHLAYLDVAVLHYLWQKWHFDDFFTSDHWVEAMVLNRCLGPLSKIHIKEWATETILPALTRENIMTYNDYDVYRELDKLYNLETELQSFIHKNLEEKGHSFEQGMFYDITSSYFEGSKCILAKYGYSRDHRPDCEQIVIALMVTEEGYPFYWQVLDGNTTDVSTVESMVDHIKRRFGIKKCTLVFDRGMVSTENLKYIRHNELSYISAMDKDEIKTLDIFNEAIPESASAENFEQILAMNEFLPVDENAFLYYREFIKEDHRYIFSFDVARFLEDMKSRERRIEQAKEWIIVKNSDLANSQKSRQFDAVNKDIKKMLAKRHLKKIIEIEIEPYTVVVKNKKGDDREVNTFRIKYELNLKEKLEEQRLNGLTCFISNIPDVHCSAVKMIDYYRRKNKVEEAFHEIKSYINLRPIHLSRAGRVKAHVSICMLSYFLLNDIEMQLKNIDSGLSPKSVLKEFAKCQVDQIMVKNTKQTNLQITEPTQEQIRLLKSLEYDNLIEEKYVKKILKKAQNWM
jgi:transposase